MTDVKQILWLIKNQLAKGKDARRTAFIRKTSTHHTPCGHNKASLETFLNDLPQQVGHRTGIDLNAEVYEHPGIYLNLPANRTVAGGVPAPSRG